jgi:hypothetical protein
MRAARGAHTQTGDDSPPGTALCPAAAAGNLAAGRDLRHTHFTTDQPGWRHGTSPWAPAIASRHVNAALAGGGTQDQIDPTKKNARTVRTQLAPVRRARPPGRARAAPPAYLIHPAAQRRPPGRGRPAGHRGPRPRAHPASVAEQHDAAAGGS